jgi:hypothetical protein
MDLKSTGSSIEGWARVKKAARIISGSLSLP